MPFLLFFLGTVAGSFLNVIALRYRPDGFLFARRVVGGRSACPHCGRSLRWYELVPIASFVLQGGQCRHCHAALSFQYLLSEALGGLIVMAVPLRLKAFGGAALLSPVVPAIWVAVFLILLLIALIDLRLQLIPDEANVLLGLCGILLAVSSAPLFANPSHGSFLGSYAMLAGLGGNIWVNRAAAAVAGALFFGFLVLTTRGKGMGVGDLKLAAALGAVFGWPDVGLLTLLGFVVGAAVGGLALVTRMKSMKSMLPFAPFLAAGAALTFFFGFDILRAYFSLFTG